MSVLERINKEIIISMKSKDRFRLTSLKYIKSLLQNNSISEYPLPEEDIVMKHHKKMVKSTKQYKNQALEDLEKEIEIISEFIPKTKSKEELSEIVDRHISLGNMGAIMKALKEEVQGPFDGKLVSELVRSKLS